MAAVLNNHKRLLVPLSAEPVATSAFVVLYLSFFQDLDTSLCDPHNQLGMGIMAEMEVGARKHFGGGRAAGTYPPVFSGGLL